ncbi:hypothetical protein [Nitratifractor salsuginis]|uniref:hypothetical protein n=1 Tax=Nitratifractor salsuginis TaxID=269261 RepID=UPI0011D0E6EF|nr:hypothetical protein [Nitratifractor salsuginis]
MSILFAVQNDQQCLETMMKLHDLQNRIVKKSFEALKPGTWAKYNDGTLALYLGEQPVDGKRLYGIEFQNTRMPVSQIWYAEVPKNFILLGRKLTFLTLDPRIAYLNIGGVLVKVDKDLIDLYLTRMQPLSIGLTPAQIQTTAKCVHDTVLRFRSGIRLPSGKVIDVAEIIDRTTGGVVYMSDEVPFGYVRTGPFGSPGAPSLVDFGYGGHTPHITPAQQRAAKPAASLLFGPGRF